MKKTNPKYARLFERVQIGKVTLKNRIGMPPMGTGQDGVNGEMTENHVHYFGARAKGGAGLIIIEGQAVTNKTDPWMFGMTIAGTLDQAKAWKGVYEMCHAYGAKVCQQLICGLGRNAFVFDDTSTPPVSASAVPSHYRPDVLCRPLEIEEIQDIVRRYAVASAYAVAVGADMLEIHAHSGYLIDQFMSPAWNKRTDQYGGSFENRMRFITEIYYAMRAAVGPDVPILVRMAADHDFEGGRTFEETVEIAKYLESIGVDALDIDMGCYEKNKWVVPAIYTGDGCMAYASEIIKKAVNIPVLNAGSYTPDTAAKAIEDGKADIILMGRGLIADPEWPNKLLEGREEDIRPCLLCNKYCGGNISMGIPIRCSVNAQAAREREFALTAAKDPKNVVVIGGGPGGMEAARVAALKGHNVTLFEKSDKLGGQLNFAGDPAFKGRIRDYNAWLKREIANSSVNVVLNHEINAESPELETADEIIVALGARPLVPKIPGIERDNVVEVTAAHADHSLFKGDRYVVCGGGLSGVDCGLELAMQGKDVTIVEMVDELAKKEIPQNKVELFELLEKYNVRQMVNTKVLEITDEGVVVEKTGERTVLPADTVVSAFGMRGESELANRIADKYSFAKIVGDCNTVGQIGAAVQGGYFAAWSIE